MDITSKSEEEIWQIFERFGRRQDLTWDYFTNEFDN